MAVVKRLYSIDDEPFDSFKRRRIEHAKMQTSSASLQLSKNLKQEQKDLSFSIVHKRNSRAASSARAEWESQLKATFASENDCELENKTNSVPASHRQLSLTSSIGIRSPVHQSFQANLEKGKTPIEKREHNKFKNFSCKSKLKTSVSEQKFQYSKKVNRKLRDLNQRQFLNELLPAPEKITLNQDDPKHVGESNLTKHQEFEYWCRKKCKNMVPLSTLLISPKEYFNLSLLPPVALEREEKYNWGHIKRNAIVRSNFIRHQIRVLQMSSQAPMPSVPLQKHSPNLVDESSALVQKRSRKAQKRLGTQTQPKVLREVEWNPSEKPKKQIFDSDKNVQSLCCVEKSNQRRADLEISQYFAYPHEDEITLPVKKKYHDESKTLKTTSISHPRIEKHDPTVTKISNQGPPQLEQGIHQKNARPGTSSPMIMNVSSSLTHVHEVDQSKERPINPCTEFESISDNEESLKESAGHIQIKKPLHESKELGFQSRKSPKTGFYRNISNEKTNPAPIDQNFVQHQDKPGKAASEGNSLETQHETIMFNADIEISDRIESHEFLHASYPPAPVLVSSKNSVKSGKQNIPSPKLSLDLGEVIKDLSNSIDLFSQLPLPYQILNGENNSDKIKPVVPHIGDFDSSQLKENKILVPDTPSTSNRSKILSFEDPNQKVADPERSPRVLLEDSGDNRGKSCTPFWQTESTNYSEDCEGSTHGLLRLLQAQPMVISENESSDDTSIHETSESRWEESHMFQHQNDSSFEPNPSQIRKTLDQKEISRLDEKDSKKRQKKKIIRENFVLRNNYHRKGFEFLPSYFSTRSLNFSFLKNI